MPGGPETEQYWSLIVRFAIFYSVIALILIWRFVLPLNARRITKILLCILFLLPMATEAYLLAHGTLASPEVPRTFLIAHNVLAVTMALLAGLILLREVIIFLSVLAGRRGERSHQFVQKDRRVAIGMVLASGGLASLGVSQAVSVARVVERDMPVPGLPAALEGLTLVQVSDLHASSLLREPHMAAMVERVNSLHPDLVLVTGDVADGTVKNRERDVAPLAGLKARLGVFVCEGNHEHYSEYDRWVEKFPALGWRFLKNSSETLLIDGAPLTIAGVADPMAQRFGREMPDVVKAFEGAPETGTRILLAHQPKFAPLYRSRARFDVQLSGHTHGGQILGMDRAVAALNGGYVYGWYPLEGGARLYVHSGTGLWNGFAVRLGVPSEIVRFTLRRA